MPSPVHRQNRTINVIQIWCGESVIVLQHEKHILPRLPRWSLQQGSERWWPCIWDISAESAKNEDFVLIVYSSDGKCVMVWFTLTDASRRLRTQTAKANVSEENWNTLLISCIHTITSWYRGGLISEPWKHTKDGKCWALGPVFPPEKTSLDHTAWFVWSCWLK